MVAAGAAVPLTARASDVPVPTCQTQAAPGAEVPAAATAPDQVAGAAATACTAVDPGSPATLLALSGSIRLELWLEELDPSTGVASFVRYASTAPAPLVPGRAAGTGAVTDLRQGVPAAGQTDPGTGWTSLGVAQFYAGVPLAVDGVAQPTPIGCVPGDFSCARSETFPVL